MPLHWIVHRPPLQREERVRVHRQRRRGRSHLYYILSTACMDDLCEVSVSRNCMLLGTNAWLVLTEYLIGNIE